MELFEAIDARRSCRSFTDEAVSLETIDEIIAAGCAAPSALNQQPWSFTVVTDPELIGELSTHCAGARDALAENSGKGWVLKYDTSFIGDAKAIVIVSADPSKIGMGKYLDELSAHTNAAATCIENMLLAITAKGLGSLWFSMYDKGYLHRTLNIAEELEIVAMLPIGVPAQEMRPVPRRDHRDVTTYFG